MKKNPKRREKQGHGEEIIYINIYILYIIYIIQIKFLKCTASNRLMLRRGSS